MARSAVAAEQFVDALAADYRSTNFDPADRAMVEYALAVTHAPHTVTAETVAALRAAGFAERGIHDLRVVAAYFAFVNRIADGLGVELEERFRA